MPATSPPKSQLSASFRSATEGRDSYIRAARHGCGADAVYDVPGMAEQIMKNARPAKAPFGSTTGRDSYIKSARGVGGPDVVYNVPGMADEVARSRSGTYAFKPGKSDRDSYIKAERRCSTDPVVVSPAKEDTRAATPRRSTTPTSAFRGSGGRDSYLRDVQHRVHHAVYDVPGAIDDLLKSPKGKIRGRPEGRDSYIKAQLKGSTDPCSTTPLTPSARRSTTPGPSSPATAAATPGAATTPRRSSTPAPFGSTSKRDAYIKEVQHRVHDVVYNVPGAIDDLLKSPKGKIRGHPEPRDSYIKSARHGCGADVVYSVPGLADEVARSRSGTYAFKPGNSARDSHIKAERRCSTDVSYTVRGMGDSFASGASSSARK